MNTYRATIINGIVLIAMGSWGYFSSTDPSPTALIPVGFGLIFLLTSPGVKKENKIVAHIVVILTLLLLVALVMPLRGAINREDTMAILRVALMMATSLWAMVTYINSFIQARRAS
ncbi:MAG: hypothetical protein R3350_03805 [Saprospiraceae bacterium]|nr:hypothetical protein [Saprospiraceae bacterium]